MDRKRSLEERLSGTHPELLARFEQMAAIVENATGEIELADEAERRVIGEVRQLGNELMRGWARQQNQRASTNFERKMDSLRRNGKKNSIGKLPLGQLK